jgi:hypothetical protein
MKLSSVSLRAALVAAPITASAQAQVDPVYACYEPGSGMLYRIRATQPTENCRSSAHQMLTWNIPGRAGPQGAAGPAGPQGPTGPVGAPGVTGLSGPVGPAGPAGAQGAEGPVGPRGEKGPVGDEGPRGPTGERGVMGMPGPAGQSGAAGATGAPGSNGLAGTNGKHAFASLSLVSASGSFGQSGHAECPAGSVLVGWGFDGHQLAGMIVTSTGLTAVNSAPRVFCLRP